MINKYENDYYKFYILDFTTQTTTDQMATLNQLFINSVQVSTFNDFKNFS